MTSAITLGMALAGVFALAAAAWASSATRSRGVLQRIPVPSSVRNRGARQIGRLARRGR